MTALRAKVLERLGSRGSPLSALALARDLEGDCDQATVYRALQWLENRGLAESFVLHCSEHGTERYYIPSALAHRHWFHCERCHAFIDLGECTLEGLIRAWEGKLGLSIRTHALQVTGLCAACRESGK